MGNDVPVAILRLPHGDGLPLPAYETDGAAGMDLRAAVPEDQPMVLEPGARALVPTGLKIAVPLGFEAQVRPRSGLALKAGITCLNSPGTIDPDYRGELRIIMQNLGPQAVTLMRGERIAQLIFARFEAPEVLEVDELNETERGEGGFGSTGTS